MTRPLSSREAVALLGITYRQLDYWCRTIFGYQPGSGGRRRFDTVDLRRLTVVARVFASMPSNDGTTSEVARQALEVADAHPDVVLLSWDGQTVRPEHGHDGVKQWLYARRAGLAPTRPTLTFLDITPPTLEEAACAASASSSSPSWPSLLASSAGSPS